MSNAMGGNNGAVHSPEISPAANVSDWPLVGFASCIKYVNHVPYHSLATQYVPSITNTCQCLPMQFPSVANKQLISAMLDKVSGIVLPGSTSNVDPERFGGTRSTIAEPYDTVRDATVFPMIEMALERGIPLLAICRGMQELNVAMGGTIHPEVHEIQGHLDHRAPNVPERDDMFAPVHSVTLNNDSDLLQAGFNRKFSVCSLHAQAVDQLGKGLKVEATAEDGTIEMLSMPSAKGFVMAVQWHPEYLHERDDNSLRIFKMFGAAIEAYANASAGE